MSDTQIDQFLAGTLLGDSYISKDNRYGFNHSAKQCEYFTHKVSILKEQGGFKVYNYEHTTPSHEIEPGRDIPETTLLQAKCSRIDLWKSLREKWYPNGTKIVPEDITLTPITLAYWYMDDGSANLRSKYISYHNGKKYEYVGEPFIQQFRLYTDGFDSKSQDLLLLKLKEVGIDSWYHTRKSGHRYLVISKLDSRKVFQDTVQPIINLVPSMAYKIDHKLTFTVND